MLDAFTVPVVPEVDIIDADIVVISSLVHDKFKKENFHRGYLKQRH